MSERMSAKQYREKFIEPKVVSSARIIITDMPPSANGLRKSFIKDGKVVSVKSDGYANWRKGAVAEIVSQAVGKVDGPYRLSIVAQRHWRSKRARDIDNIIKPVSDALVKAGVVQDDSLAECVTARWEDDLQGHAAIIDIEAAQ